MSDSPTKPSHARLGDHVPELLIAFDLGSWGRLSNGPVARGRLGSIWRLDTEGGTWAAHGVTADQVLTRVALIDDGSPSLGAYARDMVASAVDRGILAPPRPG